MHSGRESGVEFGFGMVLVDSALMLALAFGYGHGYGHLCELDLSLVNSIKFNHQSNDLNTTLE
jgi:hypothetical protein